ncbi:conserved hypothetical protein [Pediculus humanus corporis]|uniref:Uncharacterized protein n=1 Tax=Pediculus humanus subsp. corporis TaxID=121224 RepID=E0VJV4_PEDHC|nr:uncharacterized protein Phum_PHUM251610 [Pediculus humanus corporis]EEB13660.1 conserved hypothetical protein [Pediculus humanus corporis]
MLNNTGLEKYKNVDFDDAIIYYTKAIELCDDFDVAYYNRGTVLYRLGLYENAFNDLLKAFQLNPDNLDFLNAFNDLIIQRVKRLKIYR